MFPFYPQICRVLIDKAAKPYYICIYTMFEWDEYKRRSNIAKHGVDFRRAVQIFSGLVMEALDRRTPLPEDRYRALGETAGEYFIVVYTWRKGNRRIISAWKAGEHEKRKYQDLYHGRHQPDD